MTKHFLIESIRRDKQWVCEDEYKYTITPITSAIKALPKCIDEYNEGTKKSITLEVYGVKGQETAVITLRGPRARVKSFPTVLATTNFYEHFSLREIKFPDIYL